MLSSQHVISIKIINEAFYIHFFPLSQVFKFSAYLMLVAHSVCFQIFYS